MSLTELEKRYVQLSLMQMANANRNNSVAIRQLALAQLYSSNGRSDDAASQLELVRASLERSEESLAQSLAHISTALGLEQP